MTQCWPIGTVVVPGNLLPTHPVSAMEAAQPGYGSSFSSFPHPRPPSPLPEEFWGVHCCQTLWGSVGGVEGALPHFSRCVLSQDLFQLGFSSQANLAERRMGQGSRRDGRECLKCYPFSTALQKCFREKNSFELKMIRDGGGK